MKNKFKHFINISILVDQQLNNICQHKGVALKKIIFDWEKIVGEDLAQYTKPHKISRSYPQNKSHILYIQVANAAFSAQLYYMTQTLLEKIAFYVGDNYITEIKLILNPKLAHDLTETQITDFNSVPDMQIEGIDDAALLKALQLCSKSIRISQKKTYASENFECKTR